jgi:hypothetical protein
VGKYQEGYTGYVNMVKDSVSQLLMPHIPSIIDASHSRLERDMRAEYYFVFRYCGRGILCYFFIAFRTVNIAYQFTPRATAMTSRASVTARQRIYVSPSSFIHWMHWMQEKVGVP